MSTTSQKHRNFVAEPMNEKLVTDLAGIGEVLGKRLQNKGFDKVSRNYFQSFIQFRNIHIFFSTYNNMPYYHMVLSYP